MKKIIAPMLAVTLLAGCSEIQNHPYKSAGTVIGAAAGVAIGLQFGSGAGRAAFATLGGVALGIAGNQLGMMLDTPDKAAMVDNLNQALNDPASGSVRNWEGAATGNAGTAQAREPFRVADGRLCREFTETAIIGAQTIEQTGLACQGADGVWLRLGDTGNERT